MTVPTYDHIVVVMMENHNYDQIIGNTQAPYINTLAAGGALLTNYTGITHPSQPNYFALYAGTTFGITDDNHHTETGPTIATILQGAGKSFVGYVEHPNTSYDHNPWESFPEGPAVERDFNTFPKGNFAALPTVAFVTPNTTDDMHNGTIQQGDAWLAANLDSYAQWAKDNNSLLIVAWDENDDESGGTVEPSNQVAAILYGADVVPGMYSTPYNHYNMLSTILSSYGLTGPSNAATAATIDVFARQISASVTGPIVLGTGDNTLIITGTVTSTGAGIDGVDGSAGTARSITNDGTVSSSDGIGIALTSGGVVSNAGLISGATGVRLDAGGSLTNETGASITAHNVGIQILHGVGTVVNAGKIIATPMLPGALVYGVAMTAGGLVTNTGAILGGEDGVIIQGGPATVANAGTIRSNVDDGIAFFSGGNVTNTAAGLISADGTRGEAIFITGGAGAVTNAGRISAVNGAGVDLGGGGGVTNDAGAAVSGGQFGVFITGGPGTIANWGSIVGTILDGIVIGQGGTLTNNAGGSIYGGTTGVYVKSAAAAAITNSGGITGGSADGIAFAAGGMLDNMNGGVISSGQDAVFVFGGAGVVANNGTIVSAAMAGYGVALTAGGSVTNFGSIAGRDGVGLSSGGTVTNAQAATIAGLGPSGVGLFIGGNAGTLTNAGQVAGPRIGALVVAGGTIANNVTGVISGGMAGVLFNVVSGSLGNSGTIIAGNGAGIDIEAGGSVTNYAGGTISGSGWGVFTTGGPATVSNAGSIGGTANIGVLLARGGSVINAATATITGSTAGVFTNNGPAAVANSGFVNATNGAGVDLEAGGTLTNTSFGAIGGGGIGVFIGGGTGIIANSGSIAGSGGSGIVLGAGGGSVTNDLGGSISGTSDGINAEAGSTATVTNAGRIGSGSAGIDLAGGGDVTNAASGWISGGSFGIYVAGALGKVMNSGSIASGNNIGVQLNAGGSVTNAGGATISAPGFGVAVNGGAGTVTNAGTIVGGIDAVKFAGAGSNLLVVDPGAVFVGSVVGAASAANTIELAGGSGTIAGASAAAGRITTNGVTWSFNTIDRFTIDAGGTWTFSGSNTVQTLANNGTVTVAGALDVATSLDPSSSGIFQLNAAASLEVAAALGTNVRIAFLGPSKLTIDSVATFGSVTGATSLYLGPLLQSVGVGDAIDLKGFSAAGTTLDYSADTGVLQIGNDAAQKADLRFENSSLGAGTFSAASNGGGGITITLG
jgi:hypothetical protein